MRVGTCTVLMQSYQNRTWREWEEHQDERAFGGRCREQKSSLDPVAEVLEVEMEMKKWHQLCLG